MVVSPSDSGGRPKEPYAVVLWKRLAEGGQMHEIWRGLDARRTRSRAEGRRAAVEWRTGRWWCCWALECGEGETPEQNGQNERCLV